MDERRSVWGGGGSSFKQLKVNQKYNFADPATGVFTQIVEQIW
jgi:hypothetical protein